MCVISLRIALATFIEKVQEIVPLFLSLVDYESESSIWLAVEPKNMFHEGDKTVLFYVYYNDTLDKTRFHFYALIDFVSFQLKVNVCSNHL